MIIYVYICILSNVPDICGSSVYIYVCVYIKHIIHKGSIFSRLFNHQWGSYAPGRPTGISCARALEVEFISGIPAPELLPVARAFFLGGEKVEPLKW